MYDHHVYCSFIIGQSSFIIKKIPCFWRDKQLRVIFTLTVARGREGPFRIVDYDVRQ